MCGINPQDVEGYVMTSGFRHRRRRFGIFKLIDETNKEAVEAASTYIENLRANYENFSYPKKRQNKRRVCRSGKYVYFTILAETEKAACVLLSMR